MIAPLRRLGGALYETFAAKDRAILVLAIVLSLYYVSTRGIYQGKASGDGFFGFMYLPAAVYHHSLDIGPTVPQWVPYLGHEKTGHVPNACPIGPVIFWVPTYLLGLAIEPIFNAIAHPARAALPGQSPFDFWMAGLGSLLAGLCGIAILYRLLRRKLGVLPARVGVITAILATPITWYLVTQPLYQHACAFFVIALFVERWDAWRVRGDWTLRQCATLGAIGGLAMDMRLQEAIFLILPATDLFQSLIRALRNKSRQATLHYLLGGAIFCLFCLIFFAPQLATWHYFFGTLRPPQPPGHMRWSDPALLATVFSIRGGLLPWTPALYLLIPGLFAGRKALGGLAIRLGLLFALEVWVNAAAWDHWGSWTFGPRRFTDATPTFAMAFGGLFHWATTKSKTHWRRALLGLYLFFIVYNVFLMELVRRQKIRSSGSGAYPWATWAQLAKAPSWVTHLFDKTGYPFVQPAGWVFGWLHHAPPTAFEGVIGNYFLERDSRIHAVVHTPSFSFAEPGLFVVEGLAGPPEKGTGMVPIGPRLRMLIPLFGKEHVRLQIIGKFSGNEKAVRADWNGKPLPVTPLQDRVMLDVPEAQVKGRGDANELLLEVPAGTRLKSIEFESLGDWWR